MKTRPAGLPDAALCQALAGVGFRGRPVPTPGERQPTTSRREKVLLNGGVNGGVKAGSAAETSTIISTGAPTRVLDRSCTRRRQDRAGRDGEMGFKSNKETDLEG